jgi:transcriptional regulator with XRE-family HTH domain
MDSERLNTDRRIVFPTSLRKIRNTYGYSQAELAELTGLHVSYISMLENGKRNPTLQTIEKLASAFGKLASEFVKDLENN